jgi:hypothetical protein
VQATFRSLPGEEGLTDRPYPGSTFLKEGSMSDIPTVFRSRWGFHPCEYTTYRKLKLLNRVLERAVRLAHAWKRWSRKDPHNRVCRRRIRDAAGRTIGYGEPIPLAEPPLCPVFSRKVHERRFVDRKGHCRKEGHLEETVVTDDRQIASDYSTARRPAANPGSVRPLHCTVAQIDELYDQARAWLEQQDVR